MQTEAVTLDRDKARELYRKYREHQHWSEPESMTRSAAAISLSARAGWSPSRGQRRRRRAEFRGVPEARDLPRRRQEVPAAALRRRASPHVRHRHLATSGQHGALPLRRLPRRLRSRSRRQRDIPSGCRGARAARADPSAPQARAPNYHILWEVDDWHPTSVPVDPFLIRRIGKGDLWASWRWGSDRGRSGRRSRLTIGTK